jgi:hypothetical protein
MLSKKYIRENIQRIPGKILNWHYDSDKLDVFIFANRRSGSTWLMELIYSQSDFKYSDQPPNKIFNGPNNSCRTNRYEEISSMEEFRNCKIISTIKNIIRDDVQVSTPWNILDSRYSFLTSRYVVKFTDIVPFIGVVEKNVDAHYIYMLRHPIPTALSIKKKGWGPVLEPFLKANSFARNNISYSLFCLSMDIMKSGSKLERYVLEWLLRNVVPLKKINKGRPDWLVITYEHLVVRPNDTLKKICKDLKLDEINEMKERVNLPSGNADKQSLKKIGDKENEKLIRSWEDKVSKRQKRNINDMLGKFGVLDFYSAHSPMPRCG